MRSDHGTTAILWISILLALLTAMVFLTVGQFDLASRQKAEMGTMANHEEKIRVKEDDNKAAIRVLTETPEQGQVRLGEKRSRYKEAQENLRELVTRLDGCQDEIQSQNPDYLRLKASLTELHESVHSLAKALKQVAADREIYEMRATDEEAKARRLEAKIQTSKRKAANLARTNQILGNDLDHYKNLCALATEFVYPISDLPSPPDLTCSVQSVNTEHKYVMLSAGRDDKVFMGNRFTISRNGQYVGEVRVVTVYPKSCTASFVRLMDYMAFQPGDRASSRP